MRRRAQRLITSWLIAADVLAAITALAAAFVLRFHQGILSALRAEADLPLSAHGLPPLGPYLTLIPIIALLWPLLFSVQRLYRPSRTRSVLDEAFAVLVASVIATGLLFGVDAVNRLYTLRDVPGAFQYSRLFIALFLVLDIGLTFIARMAVKRRVAELRRRGFNVRRLLIVGAGKLGQAVAQRLRAHPEYGLDICGFVDDDPAKRGTRPGGLPVLGTSADILGLVQQEKLDEVIIALPWSAHGRMLQILEDTSREYLEVKIAPDLVEYIAFRAGLEDLDGLPLLNLGADPLHTWDWILKRAFDVVASCFGLVVLAPMLGVIALIVKWTSPGPVFYRQERMGLDGKRFVMVKFRTMRADAEAETGPTFALDDDPRCTWIGRWLRLLSLDELPQLVNVLKGDMSIVGPRPERPSFVREFKEKIPQYMLRHKMKSGITGWAQVNGWRGNTSIPMRIEHDLYYVANWSLGLDVKIIGLTLLRSFRRKPPQAA